MLGRPPPEPVVLAAVKPAKLGLVGVLQQASGRELEQSPLFVMLPEVWIQVPPWCCSLTA